MSDDREVNPLSLSDEDFLNAAHEPAAEPAPAPQDDTPAEAAEPAAEVTDPAEQDTPAPVEEEEKPVVPGSVPAAEGQGDDKAQAPAAEPAKDVPDAADKPADAPAVDHKAEYERIMAPFKANGRDIQVKSTDEAIRLMQMGANYNKKMEGLKPSMKILKMLDNNQLLDEQKLSFLIDISKKDPAAIQQLLKDSKIDPLSLDLENAPQYAPGSHAVSDKEVELDSVLDEVQASPTGQRTIQTVTSWDDNSKRILAENPQVIADINKLMANGIYDQIATEVDRRKVLGDLKNLSALDAFKLVGDELQAKGLLQAAATATTAAPAQPQPVATRVKTPAAQPDAERSAKARAAATTRTSARPVKQEFNPLAMSDEEFLRMSDSI
ncbi:hypothetical protein [Pseudescherichia sp.]|uniref:hypothetical protein n=1 Tax=Pseudescherichia sp. TaxID=2055881 RepID=UPI0028A70E99|nr:hypothetical protein [Pseudescherichia sp.]